MPKTKSSQRTKKRPPWRTLKAITLNLSEQELEWIEELARKVGWTRSAVIRNALMDYKQALDIHEGRKP